MNGVALHAELVRAVSPEVLGRRHETYLTEHYLASHITAVNVALATAGLSAASLLATTRASSGDIAVLSVLWFASILSVAAAYSGTMIGSIVLPAYVRESVISCCRYSSASPSSYYSLSWRTRSPDWREGRYLLPGGLPSCSSACPSSLRFGVRDDSSLREHTARERLG